MKEEADFRPTKSHPVFEILLKENPSLFTPEGLAQLLMDCIAVKCRTKFHKEITHPSLFDDRVYLALAGFGADTDSREIINRIMADLVGWVLDTPPDVKEGANFYEKCSKTFGADFGRNIFTYQNIRDNIQAIQKEMGISGLTTRNVAIRDRLFSYPVELGQLAVLESDRAVLRYFAPQVIDYFLSVIKLDPKYDLYIEINEEYYNCSTGCRPVVYRGIAVSAHIYTESYEWVKQGDGWSGKNIHKLHPDKIKLGIHLDEEENQSVYWTAIHPEHKYPWEES